MFAGCPGVTDPLLLREDITQEVPVAVMAIANGDCIDYTETSTINIRSNSDINDNWIIVQSIQVESITWEVTNYVGDDGVFINSGLLKVGGTTFEVGKVDLKAADTGNEMFVITDVAKLAAIASEMKSNGSVTLILEFSSGGNCENDYSYTLRFTADVTVAVQLP
jgi:hypothetical protein